MKTMLYIEDEDQISEIINEELVDLYKIDNSIEFKDIQNKIRNNKYDFIIVDLHLNSDTTGLEVLDFIEHESLNYRPEIFVFSGYIHTIDLVREKEFKILNPENILRKPQGLVSLLDKLKA